MRVWGRRSTVAALTALLAPVAVLVPTAAHAVSGAHQPAPPAPCSVGLVALTFDDGPSRTVTPGLVKILLTKRVPATFFMVGTRIKTAPAAARLVQNSGFKIGNHTWRHPDLTTLSDDAIRQELSSTRREMLADHLVPSTLMRPPYGAINPRVRTDVRTFGLVPVLWTIDSRDWAGGSSAEIAGRVISALRPHQTNIVLQHDGVTNSQASVAAVAEIIQAARHRGYCFTHLGIHGGMADTPGPPPAPSTPAAPTTTSTRMSASTEAWIPRTPPTVDNVGAPVTLGSWFSAPVIEEQFWSTSSFRILFGSPSGVVVPGS